MKKVNATEVAAFRRTVREYYRTHRRDMPWRSDTRPYYVLVSELMLQQTQVARVVPKFETFIAAFADIRMLAEAPLSAVLSQWIGLGYNRRAQFLHASAQATVQKYGAELPREQALLETLPGVGPNTAGAILAYAFNQPAIFIETNIRSVYLHHFFTNREAVSDTEIVKLLEATIDKSSPREWYWALMDYGAHLKATHGNNTVRSKHYKRQSTFAGSLRQMRGEVVRRLSQRPYTLAQLRKVVSDDVRLDVALQGLLGDGLVEQNGSRLYLTGHVQVG